MTGGLSLLLTPKPCHHPATWARHSPIAPGPVFPRWVGSRGWGLGTGCPRSICVAGDELFEEVVGFRVGSNFVVTVLVTIDVFVFCCCFVNIITIVVGVIIIFNSNIFIVIVMVIVVVIVVVNGTINWLYFNDLLPVRVTFNRKSNARRYPKIKSNY